MISYRLTSRKRDLIFTSQIILMYKYMNQRSSLLVIKIKLTLEEELKDLDVISYEKEMVLS